MRLCRLGESTCAGAVPAPLRDLERFKRSAPPRLEDTLADCPATAASRWLEASLWRDPCGRCILHASDPTMALLRELSASGQRFCDPGFGACQASLGSLAWRRWGCRKKVCTSWRRPCELHYVPALFSDREGGVSDGVRLSRHTSTGSERGASPLCDSIEQGSLGDCWLLAAIASIASIARADGESGGSGHDAGGHESGDSLLHDVFSPPCYNPYGFYSVRLMIDGEPRWIVIDDRIPCTSGGAIGGVGPEQIRPLFSHSRDRREVWCIMLEKAFAKLYGSYEAIEGGSEFSTIGAPRSACTADVMAALSGGIATSRRQIDGNEIFLTARKLTDMGGGAMTLGCGKKNAAAKKRLGLVAHHAYSVIDVAGGSDKSWSGGLQFLRLRNPHGKTSWNGDWSDQSEKWQIYPEIRKNLINQLALLDAGKGGLSPFRPQFWRTTTAPTSVFSPSERRDDGSFWIEMADVQRYFDHSSWCWFSDCMHHTALRGRWDAETAGGGVHLVNWRHNPRYELLVHQASFCLVTVKLTDRQFASDDLEPMMAGLTLFKQDERAGVPAYPLDCNRTACLATKNTVKARSFFGLLQPGTYWVIPDATEQGAQGDFVLQAASLEPITFRYRKKNEFWRTITATAVTHEPYGNPDRISGIPKMIFQVRSPCRIEASLHIAVELGGDGGDTKQLSEELAAQLHLCHGVHQAANNGKLCEESLIAQSSYTLYRADRPTMLKAELIPQWIRRGHSGTPFTLLGKPVLPSIRAGATPQALRITISVDCTDIDGCSDALEVLQPCTEGGCYQQWREASAPRCLVCHGPVLGRYYEVDGGVVHGDTEAGCLQRHRAARRHSSRRTRRGGLSSG